MRKIATLWVAAASAAVIIGLPSHVEARNAPSRVTAGEAAQLQMVLDEARIASGAPGVSAAIADDGLVIWTGESGVWSRSTFSTNVPITDSSMFVLASVSKMFIATIAMRLVEEGRLRLSDSITPYVPAYLPDASRVTVMNLLGHTSGYRDDEDDPIILKLLGDPNHVWTRDQLERREGPVRFSPGSRFDYCNSCYVMLGGVIEKASGASVGAELDRFVLEPLHLQDDVDIDRVARFAPRISPGYDLEHGKLIDTFKDARDLGVPTYDWGPVWTDGGVAATAIGVARFTDALFGGSLVSSKSLATMLAPGGKNEILESDKHDGRLWRGHSGFYDGFTAEAWYDAHRRLTMVVLTNRTDDNDPATQVWNRLATSYDRIRP
ncbi:MAG TPA: serine hydrolase domain-containing protein [Candidatus Eremiobacteraceae bacterium]|nr:serine hydrolase domain-containing protein [Candidatus Eremiobacteraceae bacterium]